MKYIKQFENYEKYQLDDYVLIDLEKIKYNNDYYNYPGIFKSKSESPFVKIIDVIKNNVMPYRVQFYDDYDYRVREEEIVRKLASEEIKEYELKKDQLITANKYNL